MRPMTAHELGQAMTDVSDAHHDDWRAAEITALVALAELTRRALQECVADYRTIGASWAEVAEALGTTRQGAHKRYS